MGLSMTVKADFSDVEKGLKRLPLELQKKVVPAFLNKTIAKAKTAAVRQITKEFNIKRPVVAKRMRVKKASRKLRDWQVVLDPFASRRPGRSMNLIHFLERKVSLAERRRRLKKGDADQLRFEIRKGRKNQIIKGAFIGNKGRTVFVREGASRLPIKGLSTIDVPQMFNTKRVQKAVEKRIATELPKEAERAINAAINRYF